MFSSSIAAIRPLFVTVICLVVGGLARANMTTSALPQSNAQAAFPKSVFIDSVDFGKDPYFPLSVRRQPKHLPGTTNTISRPYGVLNQIALKGISGSKGRKLALLNNVTFAAGEQASLKIGSQTVQVRCLEIRDRSALVAVEGQVQELKLRDL